jgi:regulator of replication initiation timing
MRPYLLPGLTAALALVAGLAVGGVGGWTLKPPVVETQLVPRELTEAEIEAIWAPKVAEVTQSLDQAKDRVSILEDDVRTKEAKVKDLEDQMARRSVKGAELRHQLDAALAELADVKAQLIQALTEKDQLTVELKTTVAALEDQKKQTEDARAETKVAQDDALDQRWQKFLHEGELDICDRGGRKKLGGCREAVLTALGRPEVQSAFAHCIRAEQEQPSLHEAVKDESLPQFAQYVDQDAKPTRDWYVLLCDPSLPEASRFAETQTAALN